MNEQKLIHKLKQGDRLALDRAMDTYTPYLAAVVWRALALWSHRDSLRPDGLKSWLAVVARNRAIDRLRAAPPTPLPLDEVREADGPTPAEELERRLFADALRRAVETLPPPDSQLVLRYYYEEEKLKDIARDLDLSVPAAKSRLLRARRRLKEVLVKGGLADDAVG